MIYKKKNHITQYAFYGDQYNTNRQIKRYAIIIPSRWCETGARIKDESLDNIPFKDLDFFFAFQIIKIVHILSGILLNL